MKIRFLRDVDPADGEVTVEVVDWRKIFEEAGISGLRVAENEGCCCANSAYKPQSIRAFLADGHRYVVREAPPVTDPLQKWAEWFLMLVRQGQAVLNSRLQYQGELELFAPDLTLSKRHPDPEVKRETWVLEDNDSIVKVG